MSDHHQSPSRGQRESERKPSPRGDDSLAPVSSQSLKKEADCRCSVASLPAEEVQRLERWMLPVPQSRDDEVFAFASRFDVWESERSGAGFLLEGQKLTEVCKNDDELVRAAGLTHGDIAGALEGCVPRVLRERGRKLPERYKWGRDGYVCDGYQACPFQCVAEAGGAANAHRANLFRGDERVALVRVADGRTLVFDTLLVHLIRRHGFYEGPGTEHRVDPAAIIEFFGLVPRAPV